MRLALLPALRCTILEFVFAPLYNTPQVTVDVLNLIHLPDVGRLNLMSVFRMLVCRCTNGDFLCVKYLDGLTVVLPGVRTWLCFWAIWLKGQKSYHILSLFFISVQVVETILVCPFLLLHMGGYSIFYQWKLMFQALATCSVDTYLWMCTSAILECIPAFEWKNWKLSMTSFFAHLSCMWTMLLAL